MGNVKIYFLLDKVGTFENCIINVYMSSKALVPNLFESITHKSGWLFVNTPLQKS